MNTDDARVFETVARAGRQALRELWSRRDDREDLADPEQRLLEILEAHPEYRPFWEGADPDKGENPFLHVTLHDMLSRQIESNEPPEVRAALLRLDEAGLQPHAALHALMRVLVIELGRMAGERGEFDLNSYCKAISLLPVAPGAAD